MRPDPLIFLSAGEASGDHYGAQLIEQLRVVLPRARFTGLGGVSMQAAGQQRTVRAEDVAFMGITEVLRHVPRILHRYAVLVRSIRKHRPDVAVLIDFPDVNFRLAKHCRRLGIPVIWFVSPQLWAWKRKRLRWVQQRVTRMLTIFPFEEPFYRARGVDATFVGHPLAEAPLPAITRDDFAAAHGLDANLPWIALLPGSRTAEIATHLPTLMQAASLLGNAYQFLIPVAPGVAVQEVQQRFTPETQVPLVWTQDARATLFHARAAVIASGTATVQAAVLGTPFVTVYRVSNATFRAAKRLVRYPEEIQATEDESGNLPVAMPNLIAGRRVTTELLQENFNPEQIVRAMEPLLREGLERSRMLSDLSDVRARLLPGGPPSSMERLRDAVLAALGYEVNNGGNATSSTAPTSASNE